MKMNYKIIKHTDNEQDVLLELESTNITFSNISPIEYSQEIFVVNNEVLTQEDLATYNGSFIFLEQENITNYSIAKLNQLLEILLICEQEQSIISIEVQVIDEESLILTPFIQILEPSQIALVSKNLKIDTTLNTMLHRLCMTYTKIN